MKQPHGNQNADGFKSRLILCQSKAIPTITEKYSRNVRNKAGFRHLNNQVKAEEARKQNDKMER